MEQRFHVSPIVENCTGFTDSSAKNFYCFDIASLITNALFSDLGDTMVAKKQLFPKACSLLATSRQTQKGRPTADPFLVQIHQGLSSLEQLLDSEGEEGSNPEVQCFLARLVLQYQSIAGLDDWPLTWIVHGLR